jgi:hypothetical protein
MPTFSKRSTDNLATCHRDLQKVAHEAIKSFRGTPVARLMRLVCAVGLTAKQATDIIEGREL